MVDYKAIGMRIKERRRKKGMTQEKLAERLDVTVGYISQVERGITKPNLEMIAKMAAVLGCGAPYLVSGVNANADDYLLDEVKSRFVRLSSRDKRIIIAIMDDMLNAGGQSKQQ